MSRTMTRPESVVLALALVIAGAGRGRAQAPADLYRFPTISIAGSSASCVGVATTPDGLLAYRYEARNAASSDAGIKALSVDISATRDVEPVILRTHGRFLADATGNPRAGLSHVPVGQEIPDRWSGFVFPDGRIEWRSPIDFVRATDAIDPGARRDDFTLESPYLPGIREYRLLPDYPYMCCPYDAGDPRNGEVGAKRAEDFQVVGWTIAPTYAPDAMDLDGLRTLLGQACGEVGWITNRGTCNSLDAKLAAAHRSLERGNARSATGQLRAFIAELDAQGPIRSGTAGRHVSGDAYWMLRTNAAFLLSRM